MLMTIPVTDNPVTDGTVVLPPHPGDGEWLYVVVVIQAGTILVSDSATDLVAAGLPGYADLPDDEAGFNAALVARYDDLVGHAAAFQRFLLDEAHRSGVVNIEDMDDDTLTALMQERSVPFDGVPNADTVSLAWTCPVPLVLITTDYEPFTDRPVPQGNIVWLDPITEVTYLQSLHKIGAIRFMAGNGVVPMGNGHPVEVA